MATHTFTINEFISHVLKRKKAIKSKSTKSPYFKIGGQAFYSQSLHFHEREFVIRELHNYLDNYVPKNLKIKTPIEIKFTYYAPRNFGDVSIRKDKINNDYKICWNPYKDDYVARWDLDNLHWIWSKVIKDHLRGKIENGIKVSNGLIPEDTVDHITSETSEFIEEPDLKNRRIVITINEL
jgi:hypothetical protein